MANDDESVFKAGREAADSARKHLDKARSEVGSAASAFKSTVGWLSSGTLGQKLAQRRACSSQYRDLDKALRAAETAIARAHAACEALTKAMPG